MAGTGDEFFESLEENDESLLLSPVLADYFTNVTNKESNGNTSCTYSSPTTAQDVLQSIPISRTQDYPESCNLESDFQLDTSMCPSLGLGSTCSDDEDNNNDSAEKEFDTLEIIKPKEDQPSKNILVTYDDNCKNHEKGEFLESDPNSEINTSFNTSIEQKNEKRDSTPPSHDNNNDNNSFCGQVDAISMIDELSFEIYTNPKQSAPQREDADSEFKPPIKGLLDNNNLNSNREDDIEYISTSLVEYPSEDEKSINNVLSNSDDRAEICQRHVDLETAKPPIEKNKANNTNITKDTVGDIKPSNKGLFYSNSSITEKDDIEYTSTSLVELPSEDEMSINNISSNSDDGTEICQGNIDLEKTKPTHENKVDNMNIMNLSIIEDEKANNDKENIIDSNLNSDDVQFSNGPVKHTNKNSKFQSLSECTSMDDILNYSESIKNRVNRLLNSNQSKDPITDNDKLQITKTEEKNKVNNVSSKKDRNKSRNMSPVSQALNNINHPFACSIERISAIKGSNSHDINYIDSSLSDSNGVSYQINSKIREDVLKQSRNGLLERHSNTATKDNQNIASTSLLKNCNLQKNNAINTPSRLEYHSDTDDISVSKCTSVKTSTKFGKETESNDSTHEHQETFPKTERKKCSTSHNDSCDHITSTLPSNTSRLSYTEKMNRIEETNRSAQSNNIKGKVISDSVAKIISNQIYDVETESLLAKYKITESSMNPLNVHSNEKSPISPIVDERTPTKTSFIDTEDFIFSPPTPKLETKLVKTNTSTNNGRAYTTHTNDLSSAKKNLNALSSNLVEQLRGAAQRRKRNLTRSKSHEKLPKEEHLSIFRKEEKLETSKINELSSEKRGKCNAALSLSKKQDILHGGNGKLLKARILPSRTTKIRNMGQVGITKVSKRSKTRAISPKLGSRRGIIDKGNVGQVGIPKILKRSTTKAISPKLGSRRGIINTGNVGQVGIPKVQKRPTTKAISPKLGIRRKKDDIVKFGEEGIPKILKRPTTKAISPKLGSRRGKLATFHSDFFHYDTD